MPAWTVQRGRTPRRIGPSRPARAAPTASCGACEDRQVVICEMSGYACAWRQGCNDDLAGMTRSATIWTSGECYCWGWDDDVQQLWWAPGGVSPALRFGLLRPGGVAAGVGRRLGRSAVAGLGHGGQLADGHGRHPAGARRQCGSVGGSAAGRLDGAVDQRQRRVGCRTRQGEVGTLLRPEHPGAGQL